MKSSESFDFEPLEDTPTAVLYGSRTAREAAAKDIVAAAEAEATQIREIARAEGFEAGFEAGMAMSDRHLAEPATALSTAYTALDAERADAADDAERAAIDLAVLLAEKTIGAALEIKPEYVVDVVRGGLRRLMERDRVIVLVNPEDLDIVRGAVGEIQSTLGGIGHLEVQAERRVARGGAIVRTATAEVDGRLETQLERAREAMVAALREDAS